MPQYCRWINYDSIGNNYTPNFGWQILSSCTISSYVIGYPILKYYLALMYRKNSHYPTLRTEKGTATYRRKVDSLPTLETVNRRQILLLLNQPLRYWPDRMVLYL